jgi:hypothetical protein
MPTSALRKRSSWTPRVVGGNTSAERDGAGDPVDPVARRAQRRAVGGEIRRGEEAGALPPAQLCVDAERAVLDAQPRAEPALEHAHRRPARTEPEPDRSAAAPSGADRQRVASAIRAASAPDSSRARASKRTSRASSAELPAAAQRREARAARVGERPTSKRPGQRPRPRASSRPRRPASQREAPRRAGRSARR